MTITPRVFWDAYREALRTTATRQAYASDPAWTPIAKAAAVRVCRDLGLLVQHEYLRLDVMGYTYRDRMDDGDWDLRVAFEHENCSQKAKDWRLELCKLAHIVADLRVLIGYFNPRRGSLIETVQAQVDRLSPRLHRVPDTHWLLIFGPSMPRNRESFQAFTLTVERLDDESPLIPQDFPAT